MTQTRKDKPSRRTMVKTISAALAGTLAAPALLTRARAQGQTLVVYNFDGILGKFIKDAWIDPFADKHGVRIETITMQGSSPPMAKIKAQIEAGRPDADVIPMQLTDYVFAVRNKMLLPIGRNEIKQYENLAPEFITEHGPSLILWAYGIAYNTERVRIPPKSWKDLWKPEYKGMVALNEALFEQAVQMVNLAWKGRPTPVDDETFAQLTRLRPNIVSLWTTGAQAEQLMRTGEALITPLWNGRTYSLKDQGVPIEFVKPEEGVFVRHDPYCIPRGARNPDLAKRWIDFICGADPQRALAEKLYYASPNRQVTYSPEVAKRVVVASSEDFKLAVNEDFEAVVDQLGEWRRRWDSWKQS